MFGDPAALPMLRRDERVPVDQVRAGTGARRRRGPGRYEMVRASAPRSSSRGPSRSTGRPGWARRRWGSSAPGLDGRAWRMAELAAADVYEVDHPATSRTSGPERRPQPGRRRAALGAGRPQLRLAGGALDAAGHRAVRADDLGLGGRRRLSDRADVEATVAALARARRRAAGWWSTTRRP